MGFIDWLRGITKEEKLIKYCKEGNNEKIQKYLDKDANSNTFDRNGYSPLHYTINDGNLFGTKALIAYGANLFNKDPRGYTPMDILTKKRYYGHSNESLDREGHTALMYCAMTGDKNNVEKLLTNDVDYTLRDKNGETAFQIALRRDHIRTAKAIRKNIKPIILVKTPYTVMKNVTVKREKTVTVMVDKPVYKTITEYSQELVGGTVVVDGKSQSVGHWVTTPKEKKVFSHYEKVPENRVIKYDAIERRPFTEYKWERRRISGQKDLFTNNLFELQRILSWGVNPNFKDTDNNKNTPLHYAIAQKNEDTLIELLRYGANPNYRNKFGNTSLHKSVESGFYKGALILLKRKAKLNIQNKDGFTPLHLAASKDDSQLVQILLNFGAKTNIKSKSGLTPFDVAKGSSKRLLSADKKKSVKPSKNTTPSAENKGMNKKHHITDKKKVIKPSKKLKLFNAKKPHSNLKPNNFQITI